MLVFFLLLQLKVKPFVNSKIEEAKETSKMATGIMGYFYFLFQDRMDENVAQFEEIGTHIIVLLSGIGFNSSSSEGILYDVFGVVIVVLVSIVFLHFARLVWKDIRSSSVKQG